MYYDICHFEDSSMGAKKAKAELIDYRLLLRGALLSLSIPYPTGKVSKIASEAEEVRFWLHNSPKEAGYRRHFKKAHLLEFNWRIRSNQNNTWNPLQNKKLKNLN